MMPPRPLQGCGCALSEVGHLRKVLAGDGGGVGWGNIIDILKRSHLLAVLRVDWGGGEGGIGREQRRPISRSLQSRQEVAACIRVVAGLQ